MRRANVEESPGSYFQEHLQNYVTASTGGSTGRPLRFPLFKSELELGRQHQIQARNSYGIRLGDRCLIIWGHAADLESHFRSRIEKAIRGAKDFLMGYRRISAYCLTPEVLRLEFDRAFQFRPRWIYGYSTSLLSFVRANHERIRDARALGIRACIGAAEAMPEPAKQEIAEFFNCRVGMEYGSMEMRVCAHTHPDAEGYFVFDNDYLIEALPTEAKNVFDVAVTKLFPAGMPLIRYLIGDQILLQEGGGGPVSHFDGVHGRMNDNLLFSDGTEIHSETVTHAVRSENEVIAYQLHQYADHMEMRLVMKGATIPEPVKKAILARLARVHPALGEIRFIRVDDVETTSAGKRRWIVRHLP